MLKVLIWLVSNDTRFQDNAIKILEQQHDGIEIVGEATGEEIIKVDKDYDILLVVGAKKSGISSVTKDAIRLNLPKEKLLGDWIVCIPGFTIDKYRQLQQSRLSVFSRNCFGGLLQHTLGLPFYSPLGNIGLSGENFIRFLSAPRDYVKEIPTFKKAKLNMQTGQKHNYVDLGDIWLSTMHYETFEEFIDMWDRRKTRINWDNIFVEMFLIKEEKNLLEQFDALPYAKKVCFVPFKSNFDSAWYIDPKIDKTATRFDLALNRFARGSLFYYDVFDMLLYGKKTPLIDM